MTPFKKARILDNSSEVVTSLCEDPFDELDIEVVGQADLETLTSKVEDYADTCMCSATDFICGDHDKYF